MGNDSKLDSVTALTLRQINLLRDIRRMGFMAFFDSRCRSEGPGLREMGMISGIGDSTGLSEAGLAAVLEADARITRNVPLTTQEKPS